MMNHAETSAAATPAPVFVPSAYQLAIYRDIEEGKGHTVIRARAGSGKTTTIVKALSYLPKGKKTLFVAFNKSIATELQARVPAGVQAQTTHAFGFAQLRRAGFKVTIEKNKTYIILDAMLSPVNAAKTERTAALVKTVSLAKGALAATPAAIDALMDAFDIDLNGAEMSDSERAQERGQFVATVVEVLRASREDYLNIVDFDDMIWLPIVLDLPIAGFDFVFIDETQDLNAGQIELAVRACSCPHGRIIAVGDDRQAIYGFRGADTQAISGLVRRLSAKVLPLSVTYRCARAVVAVAKTIVADLEAAPNAVEGSVTNADWYTMVANAGPGDFILSRSNAPLIGLCMTFLAEGRRAAIQGRDLAKNLISSIKRSKARDVEGFLSYLDSWESSEKRRLLARKPVAGDVSSVEDRAMCLRMLCEGAQSLAEVIARIEALFSDDDNTARIVLSTTHKAKGLERDRVWMLSGTYVRGIDSEEGQNLFYVAVTRARETLVMVADKPKGEEG